MITSSSFKKVWFVVNALVLVFITVIGGLALTGAALARESEQTSAESLTAEAIIQKLGEANRAREARMAEYTAQRFYLMLRENQQPRAAMKVEVRFTPPNKKEFRALEESGSGFVRNRVFRRLMESEQEAGTGQMKRDSSISLTNYDFELLGEEELDLTQFDAKEKPASRSSKEGAGSRAPSPEASGQPVAQSLAQESAADHIRHCYVLKATPKRKDKYLFDGKVWIDAAEFVVVKIEGRPAKNPSFWVKRADFVRRYQKAGDVWLPLRDENVTQVRILGAYTLTIEHFNYQFGSDSHGVGSKRSGGLE